MNQVDDLIRRNCRAGRSHAGGRAVYTVKLSVQEGVYEVRFSISYAGIDLPDATLTLRDANYQLVPHTQGNYNFMLRPGKYMYSVSMEGYEDVEQVIIKVVESDEPMVINVEMAPTQTVKYPVMFYLTDTDGNAVTGATLIPLLTPLLHHPSPTVSTVPTSSAWSAGSKPRMVCRTNGITSPWLRTACATCSFNWRLLPAALQS